MASKHMAIEMVFNHGFVSIVPVPFPSSIRPVTETQIIQNVNINARKQTTYAHAITVLYTSRMGNVYVSDPNETECLKITTIRVECYYYNYCC